MEQYIPKAAVVAEIKKLVRKNELYLDDNVSDVVRYQKAGAYSVLNDLLHFLNTSEVKEVDNTEYWLAQNTLQPVPQELPLTRG